MEISNSENKDFQKQFPLSPKKFVKKMLSEVIGGFFFSIFLAVIPPGIYALIHANDAGLSFKVVLIWYVISFLLFYAIRILLYGMYWKAYIRKYFYNAGDDFITIRKGVFAPTEIHVQYQKIQDVYVDQDITDRFLGLYDVHIASATASSGIEAHIDGVHKDVAEAIKNILLQKITSGGISRTGNSNSISPAQNAIAESLNLPKTVSTSTYPIQGGWIFTGILSFILSDVLIFFFGLLTVYSPGESETTTHPLTSSFLLYIVVVFVLVFLGQIVALFIWKRNYNFEFLPSYIVMRTGFFNRQEMHIPYSSVQDIIVKQSVTERILGLGTVYIQNAVANGGGVSLIGQKISSANEISNMLRTSLGRITNNYSRV